MAPFDTIVIIPAYNEEKSIFSVVSSIRKEYPDLDVVVIDDGSTDDTAKKAAQAGATVLSHPFNLGYGAAIQTGHKYTVRNDYKYLVQIDGDGQHDTRDIKVVLENLMDESSDIVLGSRYLSSVYYRSSVFRYVGIKFFRYLLYVLSGEKITDPTTGFQGMKQKVAKIFAQDLFPFDYPDADVIILLSKLGMRIKEVPARMYFYPKEKSMHSNPLRALYYLFKMILSMSITALRRY